MRIAVLRHHTEDDAGLVGESLEACGAALEVHDVTGASGFPDLAGLDGAVVLGAKWSLYDDAEVGEWIDAELDWLRRADREAVAVLGVCFGAQALAAAHGGSVEAAPRREIGWLAVDSHDPDTVGAGPWFQFHTDRCVVPPDAKILATNEVAVQAYRLRRNLAVQFHPEIEIGQLQRWMANGAHDVAVAAGIDPAQLLAETARQEPRARRRADALIGSWLTMLR